MVKFNQLLDDKKKVKNNKISDTILPEITQEEELYNLDEKDFAVLPVGSIKYELNLIEFPIFSKDKKIKENTSRKYIFSEKNDEYLEIIPSNIQSNLSKKILQEFDELIFYGLMRIYEETGSREIISNYPYLLKISGVNYANENLRRAKDSLQRMKGCSIIFNSCFFSKNQSGSIRETKTINLLSSLRILTLDDKLAKIYQKYFDKHKNLKEIFIATLNEDIVANIENKLHKYFRIEDLTEIKNSTARKIYVMLTKWRYWQKDVSIRRTIKFLASRIPLSWKKTNLSKTIKSIENACVELKRLGKLKDYKINIGTKLEESTIDFYFDTKKNILDILNSKFGIEETGHENLEIVNVEIVEQKLLEEREIEIKKNYSCETELLYRQINKKEQIELLKDLIEESIKKYSVNYVKSNILYANKNSKVNYPHFLKKSINNDYAKMDREKEEKKIKIKLEKEEEAKKKLEKIEQEENELNRLAIEKYGKMTEKSMKKYEKYYSKIPDAVKKNFVKKDFIIGMIKAEIQEEIEKEKK